VHGPGANRLKAGEDVDARGFSGAVGADLSPHRTASVTPDKAFKRSDQTLTSRATKSKTHAGTWQKRLHAKKNQ